MKIALSMGLLALSTSMALAQQPAGTVASTANSSGTSNIVSINYGRALSGSLPEYDIYYFRQQDPSAVGSTGTRLRLGLAFNFRSTTVKPDGQDSRTSSSYNVSPRIGYEWLSQVANRFTFGAGIEGGLSFSGSKAESVDRDGDVNGEITSSNFGIGAGPIISGYWQAAPWLLLGLESSAQLDYRTGTDKFNPAVGDDVKNKVNTLGFNLIPIYRLSLAYRF